MSDDRPAKVPDHTMHPRKAPVRGRDLEDPRTDPAPGLQYGTLGAEERPRARQARLFIAGALIVLIIVVAILLIA
jgi:hypothetical protein